MSRDYLIRLRDMFAASADQAPLLLVAAIASIGCASHRQAGSPSAAARDDERVAILNIHPSSLSLNQ
jgi:hypothetical protein